MSLALLAAYFGPVNEAQAFCIYNKTEVFFQVKQTHGGTHVPFKRFNIAVEPGGKACCNWQTHDCNTEGKKDASVKFNVSYAPQVPRPGEPPIRFICRGFEIHANGKRVIYIKDDDYACKKEWPSYCIGLTVDAQTRERHTVRGQYARSARRTYG